MHLVEAGFRLRFEDEVASGDTSLKDVLWWFGYLIGLLEAGLITRREHNNLSSHITETLTNETNP